MIRIYPGYTEDENGRRQWHVYAQAGDHVLSLRVDGGPRNAWRVAHEVAREFGGLPEVPPEISQHHMEVARELAEAIVRRRCLLLRDCITRLYIELMAAGIQPERVVDERIRLEAEIEARIREGEQA